MLMTILNFLKFQLDNFEQYSTNNTVKDLWNEFEAILKHYVYRFKPSAIKIF